MCINRVFSSENSSVHGQRAGMLADVAVSAAPLAAGSPFALIAWPSWPGAGWVTCGVAAPPSGTWQMQQRTFQQAFEQARALLSPPRHEQIMAGSWN
jgi:hypothetical protein